MADVTYRSWPFFDEAHRELAARAEAWAGTELAGAHASDVDRACRDAVRSLGAGGWLRLMVPREFGGSHDRLDVRSICLVREILARHDPLVAFAFAMQGLGSVPITLYGTDAQRRNWLPPVARGERVAAFAISERDAGSDVAAMATTARAAGDGFVIDGEKAWISNAGIADHYVVFSRMPEEGDRAFGAFIVDATNPGLAVSERIDVIAPHPIGSLRFTGCKVPGDALIGPRGKGLRVALGSLDVFRTTVGAEAVGMARRALDEAMRHVAGRRAFGQPLSGFQLTQARLADMAVAIDASALLVYRAAWTRDAGAERVTREAAMAKLFATESAQRVIDDAVQLLGGLGVVSGNVVERLYREIRSLRIYEGTSEIQRLVIAQQLLEPA